MGQNNYSINKKISFFQIDANNNYIRTTDLDLIKLFDSYIVVYKDGIQYKLESFFSIRKNLYAAEDNTYILLMFAHLDEDGIMRLYPLPLRSKMFDKRDLNIKFEFDNAKTELENEYSNLLLKLKALIKTATELSPTPHPNMVAGEFPSDGSESEPGPQELEPAPFYNKYYYNNKKIKKKALKQLKKILN
ncbi:MAG: hypothetical protein ACTSVC_05480 [Promethearchaeota archaeon]